MNRRSVSTLIHSSWGQVALFVLMALVALLLTRWVVSDILVREALTREAEHFWAERASNAAFALPSTANLQGYLGASSTPPILRGLEPGLHELIVDERQAFVLVSEQQGERLVLKFDNDQVSELTLMFGLLPIAVATLPMLAFSLAMRRRHLRTVSPYRTLAEHLRELDLESPQLVGTELAGRAERDSDVAVMAEAVDVLTRRVAEFVRREREFTLDVSHELRTPLSVILAAANVALLTDNLEPRVAQQLERISRTVRNLRAQLEALLILAREEPFEHDLVDISAVAAQEIAEAESYARQGLTLKTETHGNSWVETNEQAVRIILRNLLNNAVKYSDEGTVRVLVRDGNVTVTDQGIGMGETTSRRFLQPFFRGGDPAKTEGMGVGMAIVARLAQRLGATIHAASAPGQGTRVDVVLIKPP